MKGEILTLSIKILCNSGWLGTSQNLILSSLQSSVKNTGAFFDQSSKVKINRKDPETLLAA